MTVWLDFRTEPIMDVPEVSIVTIPGNPNITIAQCQALDCDWSDTDSCRDDVESGVAIHKQWHEDGMPV